MTYTVILERGRQGGYVVTCSALRGCLSQGGSRREALKNIREGHRGLRGGLLEDGLAVSQEAGKEFVEL